MTDPISQAILSGKVGAVGEVLDGVLERPTKSHLLLAAQVKSFELFELVRLNIKEPVDNDTLIDLVAEATRFGSTSIINGISEFDTIDRQLLYKIVLSWSIRFNQLEPLRWLVQRANSIVPSPDNLGFLNDAISKGKLDVPNFLYDSKLVVASFRSDDMKFAGDNHPAMILYLRRSSANSLADWLKTKWAAETKTTELLVKAIESNHIEAIKFLLDNGYIPTDSHSADKVKEAVIRAAEDGQLGGVEVVHQSGFVPGIPEMVMTVGLQTRWLEVVRWAIKANPDMDLSVEQIGLVEELIGQGMFEIPEFLYESKLLDCVPSVIKGTRWLRLTDWLRSMHNCVSVSHETVSQEGRVLETVTNIINKKRNEYVDDVGRYDRWLEWVEKIVGTLDTV